MALATNTTPGSIILSGDLTGNANAPELRITGVTAGNYINPTVVVDAKGRLIYASDSSPSLFDGDVQGPSGSLSLTTTGVIAGSYIKTSIIVDAKGRLTEATANSVEFSGVITGPLMTNVLATSSVTPGQYNVATLVVEPSGIVILATPAEFSGDVEGVSQSLSLKVQPAITAGTYPLASFEISATGLLLSINGTTVGGLGGDLTGSLSNNFLSNTGISSGAYPTSTITVDAKGRITAITPAFATDTTLGIINVGTGLYIAGGELSGSLASSTAIGLIESTGTGVSLSAGNLSIASPVVTIDGTLPSHTSTTRTTTQNISVTNSLDLVNFDYFYLKDVSVSLNVSSIDTTLIRSFTIFLDAGVDNSENVPGYDFPPFKWVPSAVWTGSMWALVYRETNTVYLSPTAAEGSWTAHTIDSAHSTPGFNDIAWNGSLLVVVGNEQHATSADGITWTIYRFVDNPGTVYQFKANRIIHNGYRFYAVGSNYMDFPVIASSVNGVIWSPCYSISNTDTKPFEDITWTGNTCIAVAGYNPVTGNRGAIVKGTNNTNPSTAAISVWANVPNLFTGPFPDMYTDMRVVAKSDVDFIVTYGRDGDYGYLGDVYSSCRTFNSGTQWFDYYTTMQAIVLINGDYYAAGPSNKLYSLTNPAPAQIPDQYTVSLGNTFYNGHGSIVSLASGASFEDLSRFNKKAIVGQSQREVLMCRCAGANSSPNTLITKLYKVFQTSLSISASSDFKFSNTVSPDAYYATIEGVQVGDKLYCSYV